MMMTITILMTMTIMMMMTIMMTMTMLTMIWMKQAEARAEFAEKSVQKLQKEV